MRNARGFTLIEIVVVLLILGVMIAMAAAITRGVVAGQKRSITATRMAGVDSSLVQFVLQQKRLPCPGNGTLASTDNNAGLEGARDATGCTGNQQHGIVPWRALGLTDVEVSDGWDRRLTYRIQPGLAADNGMDMSWCDPAGTGPAIGANNACNNAGTCASASLGNCTPPATFLAGKGLEVRNVAGTVVMMPAGAPNTGAAYVLISHGETGGGAYLNSGVLATSTVGDGVEEQKNYANLAFVPGPPATHYIDDSIMEVAAPGHFDDIVSRPTVLGVVSKAGLAPRSH